MKYHITEKQSRNLLTEGMEYYQEKYPEQFNRLNALDDKALKAELDRLDKLNDYNDDISIQKYLAQEILKERKNKVYELMLDKIKGQPFLGSKIRSIGFPDSSEDGKFDTFYIYLDNDTDFEFNTTSMDFRYFDENMDYHTQYVKDNIPPEKAILTAPELKLLRTIVKLNNMDEYNKKKPYPPTRTIVKDMDVSKSLQLPTIEENDIKWVIGKGGENLTIKDVKLRKKYNDDAERYSSSYLSISFDVRDKMFGELYSYTLWFDNFNKPKDEELTKYGYGIDGQKVTDYVDSEIYEYIIKVIQQVNPKSKLASKLRPINYHN